MKINSEKLFGFVNNLGTDEKVRFKVFYDDNYVTEIYWDGENFNWEPGTFTSGMFFDPLVDFEEIEEDKRICKIPLPTFEEFKNMTSEERYQVTAREYDLLNFIIDKLNKMNEDI